MKVLIIGYGSIGQRHAHNAALWCQTAVYDTNDKLMSDTGTITVQLRDRPTPTLLKCFNSLEEALKWSPDAIIIATDTSSHVETTKICYNFLGNNILIEKPVATYYEDARELQGMKGIYVVNNYSYHEGYSNLRKCLKKVGTIRSIRIYYGNRRGDARQDIVHFIGLARELIEKPETQNYFSLPSGNLCSLVLDNGKASAHILMDYMRCLRRIEVDIVGTRGVAHWVSDFAGTSDGITRESCTVTWDNEEEGEAVFSTSGLDTNKMYQDMLADFLGPKAWSMPINEGIEVLRNAQSEIR